MELKQTGPFAYRAEIDLLEIAREKVDRAITSMSEEAFENALGEYGYVRERTCRIKEDADTGCFLTCSECGAIQPEEWTVYYCWSCGARVVEEVDADGQG